MLIHRIWVAAGGDQASRPRDPGLERAGGPDDAWNIVSTSPAVDDSR